MKLLSVIVSLMVHVPGFAAEITPREWVSFLHQVSTRGKVQYSAPNVAFSLERRSEKSVEILHLVGVSDGEGGFTPSAVVQVQQTRSGSDVHVVATQVDLSGEIREISSRTLSPRLVGSAGEPSSSPVTDEQKAEWSRSLEQWRAQVGEMPDRVGRFDAKEVAI